MTELDRVRAAAAAEVLTWVGTEYHHQSAQKGIGADCVGLALGVYRVVIGPEPYQLPPYTANWHDARGAEPLIGILDRYLTPIDVSAACSGDLIVFRIFPSAPAKHCGILVGGDRMVHARSRHKVMIEPFGRYWRRRAVGAYAFLPAA